ncbi:kinase-like domain-containing protein [Hygrophoropsis aurantiaca]|uniref:Kinase-like domain-containing protein n=1 Tax=Hygrophoropsis aurantiaca TaxID=72124 RepID=A0ACB8A1K1_9AGAM|nr:kinase-like domain-containing protein [Hygrophoropsis aurantiaca]
MVISPKLRQKRSSSVKESSLVDVGSSFKFLHVLPGHHANPIHLCRKRDTFKLYAMTIVRKDRTTSSAHVRHIETEREISQFILSLCNPFLAPYLWIFQDETAFYSVSDFYGGGNLREHIEQEGPISLDRAYFFACEILVGLNALHEEGIVHRDLRPENIMINVSGHIAIAGFQYSGNAQSPASLQQLGNNEYQPPEVLLGWAHDVKVDSWSFGTILHMMLFSSHPFVTTDDRDNAAVLQAKVVHCPVSFPNSRTVSWAAQDLIAHCLQRNSALRYDVRAIKAHVYFCSV